MIRQSQDFVEEILSPPCANTVALSNTADTTESGSGHRLRHLAQKVKNQETCIL